MLQVKQVAALIEEHIQHAGFPTEPSGLYDPARYILSAGGKRIRPCLTLMSANLFTPAPEQHIPVALAMEVFHNFTLVHDDIMDNAPVRRGMPTVHEKWNIHTGILSGDVMMIQAYRLLCQNSNPHLADILNMFNNTAMQVCEGQQSDMDFEMRSDVVLEEYIQMITYKTSVLLGCSLYCGAKAAGADETDAMLLYNTGVALGVSFQIQDDVLDAYGDEATFGKKPGGDIVQNKKTYLYLKALELANEDDAQKLHTLYSDKPANEAEKIAQVKQLFEKYQIRKVAEQTMAAYYESALQSLKAVNVPAENKVEITKLITAVFGRSH
jgi:geranylgeranyl diphosphate synthase, type II